MSAAKHTPGPWMIYDMGDIASAAVRTDEHTVIRAGNVKGATIGEAMANANLIAAAPELAETLRNIVERMDAYGTLDTSDGEEDLAAARAALAKAGV